VLTDKLVSQLAFNVPCQHKEWLYQRRKVTGGELSLPSDTLTSTLAAFFQQPPKKG